MPVGFPFKPLPVRDTTMVSSGLATTFPASYSQAPHLSGWPMYSLRGVVKTKTTPTPNKAMKRTSLPVTSFAFAKEPPATVGRLSRR